jgi:hypothetical protein
LFQAGLACGRACQELFELTEAERTKNFWKLRVSYRKEFKELGSFIVQVTQETN